MSEFFHMGGYAAYVWGSFAATAVVFIWNAGVAARAESRVKRNIVLAEDDE